MKVLSKYPELRLRRNRKYSWTRRLVEENNLTVNDLILPIFITEGKNKIEPIKNMPNISRYSIDQLSRVVNKANKLGIPLVAIFPHTSSKKKNFNGSEALNENNLVCKAIKKIAIPESLWLIEEIADIGSFIKKRFINVGRLVIFHLHCKA